jgi:hypothetical protein
MYYMYHLHSYIWYTQIHVFIQITTGLYTVYTTLQVYDLRLHMCYTQITYGRHTTYMRSYVSLHCYKSYIPFAHNYIWITLEYMRISRRAGFLVLPSPFLSGSLSQKTIKFVAQVWAFAVVVRVPPEILGSYHFFHLSSSWCRFLIFIPLYSSISAHPSWRGSRRYGS